MQNQLIYIYIKGLFYIMKQIMIILLISNIMIMQHF